MILYIVLAIVLWFVVPLFVDGHVKNKNDRKAWRLLSRIIAVLMLVLMIYHEFLQYDEKVVVLYICLALLSSCSLVGKDKQGDNNVVTPVQETMMANGWELSTPEGGDFDESMGIKPVYGLQDNYFDITIGNGFSVAVKIMSLKEHKCIRYIFVPEGQTVTVNEIPQGKYYLKLAYGNDWMVKTEGNHTLGNLPRMLL